MKRTYQLIALSSLAFACASQPPTDAPARTETAPNAEQLQSRMHDMQALMDRIHETSDLQERHRLMQKHMQSMRDGMTMMGRMMREPGDVSTEGPGNAQDHEAHH